MISPAAFCSLNDNPFGRNPANDQPVHDKQVDHVPAHGNDENVTEHFEEGCRINSYYKQCQ